LEVLIDKTAGIQPEVLPDRIPDVLKVLFGRHGEAFVVDVNLADGF